MFYNCSIYFGIGLTWVRVLAYENAEDAGGKIIDAFSLALYSARFPFLINPFQRYYLMESIKTPSFLMIMVN